MIKDLLGLNGEEGEPVIVKKKKFEEMKELLLDNLKDTEVYYLEFY